MVDALALALRKQRLQLRSAQLRQDWLDHAQGVRPLLTGADRVGDGVAWIRRHPQALVAAAVAAAVVRPRGLFRWARRAVAGWQVWRQARRWLQDRRIITAP